MKRMSVAALLFTLFPSVAYATDGGHVPVELVTGVGVVALLLAVGLLVQMIALRRLAEGAAIADNIAYAVFAVVCLAAATLAAWISRILPAGFSEEQARLGADLLTIAAMAFLGVYFWRVRRAMAKFLRRLTGEEQLLASALDPDADVAGDENDGA